LAEALGGAPLRPVEWVPVLVTPFVLIAQETRKAFVRRRRS
jgi:hypothetical protein